MPVIDEQPRPGEPIVVVEPSLAVELEWVMDSAMHLPWQAEHPDLDEIYRSHPELTAELTGLWGPDLATGCNGFLELTVLAELAGQLFTTDADVLFDALAEAMAHSPTDPTHLPLHSEKEGDRAAVWNRLSVLRRSKVRRQRYLELARRTWDAAAGAWQERGRPSVDRAIARRRKLLSAGATWQEVVDPATGHEGLATTLAAVGPDARVAAVPSYFAHKCLYVDVGQVVLISVRSEPMANTERARTQSLARQLKTISDPSRLAILDRLRRSPATVTELAAELSLAQPTVSNHVKLLRDAGLVVDVRHDRRRQLVVQTDVLGRILGGLQELLATGSGA